MKFERIWKHPDGRYTFNPWGIIPAIIILGSWIVFCVMLSNLVDTVPNRDVADYAWIAYVVVGGLSSLVVFVFLYVEVPRPRKTYKQLYEIVKDSDPNMCVADVLELWEYEHQQRVREWEQLRGEK